MSLLPEKMSQVKLTIQNHLKQAGIHSQVRKLILESMKDGGTESQPTEEVVLNRLKEKGVLEEIIQRLNFDQLTIRPKVSSQEVPESVGIQEHEQKADKSIQANSMFEKRITSDEIGVQKVKINPNQRHLYLQIVRGKAFVDHLLDEPSLPGEMNSRFLFLLHFRGQRYWTKPTPCSCEPEFKEGFLFELHRRKTDFNRMADLSELLTLSDPLHVVLVKLDQSGERHLLSSYFMEWRQVLSADDSRKSLFVELYGVGAESGVPIGMLELKLQLIPKAAQPLSPKVIGAQINLERNRIAELERIFLLYSKNWWREYLEIRPEHASRTVKIFAQDENLTIRCVRHGPCLTSSIP